MTSYSSFDRIHQNPSYKTVFVGDAGCGKSSIIHKFHYGDFSSIRHSTIGGEFKSVEIKVDNKIVNLQTWDTAGQERYRSLVKLYFRGTDAIVFVFDLTNDATMFHIDGWINEYIMNCPTSEDNSIPLYLVGNKIDLASNCKREYIDALIKKYNLVWFETSAKSGYNIDALFTRIAIDVTKNNNSKMDDEFVDITEPQSMLSIGYLTSSAKNVIGYIPYIGNSKCC